MSTDKEKSIKFLDTLSDALGRSEDQSADEIKAELRDEGMDVDAIFGRLQQTRLNISMAAKKSALDTARTKRLQLAKTGNKFIGKFRDWSRERILTKIKELGGLKAEFAHRSLETMGTEEINALLEDLEMARHQAELEDNHGESY